MALLDHPGHVFVLPGDLTQLRADVVVYSTSTSFHGTGHLRGPFVHAFPWFADALDRAVLTELPPKTGCEAGHAFCLNPPDGRGPAVVVVASTIDPYCGTATTTWLSRDELAARAVRGALAAAHADLKSHPTDLRRLVALPTLRLGRGGDRNDRLRSARTQIRVAHECLKAMPGVDVAFTAYTPDNYQIFLQARRQELGGPACPLPEGGSSARLTRLVREVRGGRCVLFAGSGLSWQLPGWNDLMNALAADLGRPPRAAFNLGDALDLAEDYVWQRGGSRLAEEIRGRYVRYDRACIRPTAAHYHLLSLPLRLVITTNYDDLLERTLTCLRRRHRLITRDPEVVHTGKADPLCVVKFHGDPTANDGRGIVLARGHYEAFRAQHPGLALLLAGSLLNQTFLFVGYSRIDPNFQEIFAEVGRLYEGAGWQAFATSVESPAPTPSGGPLELLPMPGADVQERIYFLSRFVDWLTDAVQLDHDATAVGTGGVAADLPPKLFLAPDAQVAADGPAAALRAALLNEVAAVVAERCEAATPTTLGPAEARHVARVLQFLVAQGWRPMEKNRRLAAERLSLFWERLADCVGDPQERARCLAAAWGFAEDHDDVTRLRDLLDRAGS